MTLSQDILAELDVYKRQALFLSGAFSVWAADTPVKGGTLIYLEQQPHTNLYPPAGGFYPNGDRKSVV